jgi:hypothetical protein
MLPQKKIDYFRYRRFIKPSLSLHFEERLNMAEYGRGIKAGLIGGIVAGIVLAVLTAILIYVTEGSTDFANTITTIVASNLIGYIIFGIIFGIIFAAIYDKLPGATAIMKGMSLAIIIWILGIIIGYFTTFQTFGITTFGGNIIIGLISSIIWGYIIGRFWG